MPSNAPGARLRQRRANIGTNSRANLNCCGVGSTRARPPIAAVYPPLLRRVSDTSAVCRASGRPAAPGATARMDWRTDACGKRMPSWLQNEEAQAPPAMTTVLVRIVPVSVTTPLTRPARSSMPRAAQCWCTVPPAVMIARATTGTAFEGSAVPSVGENTPPFHLRPVALPLSLASFVLNICVVTPTVFAKSRHFAQPVSSFSSFDR